MSETILVTGGTGFIGSHTVIELLNNNYRVVIVDDYVNSSARVYDRICEVVFGKDAAQDKIKQKLSLYNVTLLDRAALENVFKTHADISGVIHFAALKAVGESVAKPLDYYSNNITGTLNLLHVMQQFNVHKIVFSSSATVYGEPKSLPLKEDHPLAPTNPYGQTKFMIEQILRDVVVSAPNKWGVILLRYFNPIGAHPSGRLGEDPNGIPNNLLPFIARVAVGKLPSLKVFGKDYNTVDGTGVRDYIHILDLVNGHIAALKRLNQVPHGCHTYNLGTGHGFSVLQVIQAYERASGRKIPHEVVDRRAGDVAEVYADASLAEKELGWKAVHGIDKMCEDSWRWAHQNPDGFNTV
jgi:UDP-glucose 4-epimerase